MNCPNCKKENLKKVVLYGAEVDYCPKCLGLWFDKDELRRVKDEKDRGLAWLDIDLWQDKTKFKVGQTQKVCPKSGVPLYVVKYSDANIEVDVCDSCFGVWLDRGEFKKIIEYLKKTSKDEILYNYFNNLIQEAEEVFIGPEGFKSELADFLAVLKLLNYKFATHHPFLTKAIAMLPH